jgi:hypothetical protein
MKQIDRNPNKPINFCHIAPTPLLNELTKTNGAHLLLAHLVEEDPIYRQYYVNLKDNKLKIMDNSAFEMFKQGRPMYEASKLTEMGTQCGADVIVMSDYPKESWTKTRDAAIEQMKEIKAAGFGTFYVPQSELGDTVGLIRSFAWALEQPEIDLIGVSILACPIAMNVNESKHGDGERNDAYKLQRFLSRWKLFRLLRENNLLGPNAEKRFHCLGMTDGPNEITLLEDAGYAPYIYSWDSSAAPWAGLNGKVFDFSPTGLMNGKIESEVDFNHNTTDNGVLSAAAFNIRWINALTGKRSEV